MAGTTGIEWTETTWNPIVGCSLASPGCTNCYAMKMAGRVEATGHSAYQGLTKRAKTGFVWTGKLAMNEKALLEPLRWKKPRMVFVNSMGDLFHEDCSDEWIDRVFAVMALCPQHTFQVLTKRSARMQEYLTTGRSLEVWRETRALGLPELQRAKRLDSAVRRRVLMPLPNVWLGVSVEDQQRADERIPELLATPAAVRWISAEPLLGPINLTSIPARGWLFTDAGFEWSGRASSVRLDGKGIDWVVAGGESGPGARGSTAEVEQWMRGLRDQCQAAGVPFFGKQNFRKMPLPVDLLLREWPHA